MQVVIEGASPLLMNSNDVLDPAHPITKERKKISTKRQKTESDLEELSRLDFYGALYHNGKNLIIPSRCLEACLVSASKKMKLGPKFKAGVFVDKDAQLDIGKKPNLKTLFDKKEHVFKCAVRIQNSSVLKTRPIFKKWKAKVEITYLDDLVSKDQLQEILNIAGRECGLLDWRPKYGRFKVK